jgi:hypothetical protein
MHFLYLTAKMSPFGSPIFQIEVEGRPVRKSCRGLFIDFFINGKGAFRIIFRRAHKVGRFF